LVGWSVQGWALARRGLRLRAGVGLRFFEGAGHGEVGDIGFLEFGAGDGEVVGLVEGDGGGLGVEVDLGEAGLKGVIKGGVEKGGADALTAPGGEDGHATDATGSFVEAGGADRVLIGVEGEEVGVAGIGAVEFEGGGDLLFFDEDDAADGADEGAVGEP
jgi:hypothetical protein